MMIESYIAGIIDDLTKNYTDVDRFFTVCAWFVLVAAALVLYVFLVTALLPNFLLSPVRADAKMSDRGIKKYIFPDGRGVVYEPALNYRRYISKYALFEYKGNKYIKLSLGDSVSTIECELGIYNNKGKLVKTTNIFFETLDGESNAALIPKETSYVGLTIIAVNGEPVESSEAASVSLKKWGIYAGITTALTVAIGFLIRGTAVFAAEWIFYYSRYEKPDGFLIVFIVSLIVGALISVIGGTLYQVKKRSR